MFYLSDDKYESHIKAVLSECPEADTDEIKAAFVKYEEEFYIPPCLLYTSPSPRD